MQQNVCFENYRLTCNCYTFRGRQIVFNGPNPTSGALPFPTHHQNRGNPPKHAPIRSKNKWGMGYVYRQQTDW